MVGSVKRERMDGSKQRKGLDSAKSMKVLVSTPNLGWVHNGVVVSIIDMMKHNCGHSLHFNFSCSKPIESNRNSVVRMFLKDGFDYLLFIDADNPPIKNPLELVELDLDIVIFPTPIWYSKIARKAYGAQPIVWNAMMDAKDSRGFKCWREDTNRGGLREIDAGGTGVILSARRVLEKVRPAFMREWDEDGVAVRGSDFLFCDKARKAGFKVWAHWDYYCKHYKEVDLAEMYRVYLERDISNMSTPNINTPQYWDEVWEGNDEWEPEPEPYNTILKNLNGESRILDFGCGRGDLLEKLGPEAVGVDWSPRAVEFARAKGLNVKLGNEIPEEEWDCIICCDVIQTFDDDAGFLQKLFEYTDKVVYAVPYDCLPPGLVPHNRRVYTPESIRRVTPHLKKMEAAGDRYVVVLAEKEA